VWLSAAGDEIEKENFIEYENLKACEAHMKAAKGQKGKEGYPNEDETVYTLKDAFCKKKE
jgi:hypothetical protein